MSLLTRRVSSVSRLSSLASESNDITILFGSSHESTPTTPRRQESLEERRASLLQVHALPISALIHLLEHDLDHLLFWKVQKGPENESTRAIIGSHFLSCDSTSLHATLTSRLPAIQHQLGLFQDATIIFYSDSPDRDAFSLSSEFLNLPVPTPSLPRSAALFLHTNFPNLSIYYLTPTTFQELVTMVPECVTPVITFKRHDIRERRRKIESTRKEGSVDPGLDFPHVIVAGIGLSGWGGAKKVYMNQKSHEVIFSRIVQVSYETDAWVKELEEVREKSSWKGVVKKVTLRDEEEADIEALFDDVLQFVHEARTQGEKVLIHCGIGMSRSATFVVAYLMRYEKMNLNKAWRTVFESRPWVHPNPGFAKVLLDYEKKLFGVKKSSLHGFWLSKGFIDYLELESRIHL